MFNFSKRNLIIISAILSLVILISLNFFLNRFKEFQKKNDIFNQQINQIKSNEYVNKNIEKFSEIEEVEVIENQYSNSDWRILISKINLDAPILEGTSQEVLRRGVGHFENTSTWDGNVCLAAHNRGYKYNFFQEIKNLEIGDIIEYQKSGNSKTYSVKWKGKIKETDLSYLENTNDNEITLITCVENMPEYRLCVQACEIKMT